MNNIDTHAFRLHKGQDLKLGIEQAVHANNIRAGWIVAAVGSVTDYHLRFANQPAGSSGSGHFEIVSITGTL